MLQKKETFILLSEISEFNKTFGELLGEGVGHTQVHIAGSSTKKPTINVFGGGHSYF